MALVAGIPLRKHRLTLSVELSLQVTLAEFFNFLATNGGTCGATLTLGVLVDAVFLPSEELRTFVGGTVEGCWRGVAEEKSKCEYMFLDSIPETYFMQRHAGEHGTNSWSPSDNEVPGS